LREHGRLASKSNKSTTARVGSLTREGSEQDSKSRANSTLAQNQEGKETTQCEKELRECGSLANMLNRTMTREGIKGDNESMANMMLPENKQAQHEKEFSECARFAKLSNISTRPRIDSPSREKSEQDSESKANSKLEHIQEGEVTAQHEKERREHGRLANKSNRSTRARVDLWTTKASE